MADSINVARGSVRSDTDEFRVEAGIDTIGGEQTFMGAALNDSSLVKNENQIRLANRAQTMGDND